MTTKEAPPLLGLLIVFVLAFGIALLLAHGTQTTAQQPKDPNAVAEGASEVQEHEGWAEWGQEPMDRAKRERKLIVIDVFATWCGPCKLMDSITFSDPKVRSRLKSFVAIKIDADIHREAAGQYSPGTLPTISILTPDGYPLLQRAGYQDPEHFLNLLNEAEKTFKGIQELENNATKDIKDIPATLSLANSYLEMGRAADSVRLLHRIMALGDKLDDESRARAIYQLGLSLLMNRQHDKGLAVLNSFDHIFPAHELATSVRQLIQEGTFHYAETESSAGNLEKAKTLYQKVVNLGLASRVAFKAKDILQSLELLNKPAPPFAIEKWLTGTPLTLKQLKGQVVLLDLFQIICPGCEQIHPFIVEMQNKYKTKGLQTIGIAVAFELQDQQTEEKIISYVNQKNYNYPVALDKDNTAMFDAYHAKGTPYAILIDRKGNVRHLDFYRPKAIEKKILELLAEKP